MNAPVIFITGAGKGIGEACVIELIRRSASWDPGVFQPKLFLTSRTKADLDRLATRVSAAGLEVAVLARDIADAPIEALDAAILRFGAVDVALHCAGVGRFGDFLSLTADDVEFVMKTNVEASFLLMQGLYRQMRAQRADSTRGCGPGGLIQWVTSVAAEKPFEQSAVYCMSKYAQRGLIEVMRLWGRREGVRLLEVKPGATFTPMWGELPAEMQEKMMQPADVAQAMVDAIFIPARASVEEITIRPSGGDL